MARVRRARDQDGRQARRKLAADLVDDDLDPAELRARVFALGDLGRFRIVCGLPRDVRTIRRHLVRLRDYRVARVKDFVRDPALRKALLGHRAVQFRMSRDGVHVEVQLMTTLQHAWDRRNHCFYEWLRLGRKDREAIDLRVDDHAVAEALHVSDRIADQNFGRFLAMRRRRP